MILNKLGLISGLDVLWADNMARHNTLIFGSVIIIGIIGICAYPFSYAGDNVSEVEDNVSEELTGDAIGGGSEFVRNNPDLAYCDASRADIVAEDKEELLSAIKYAESGDIIFVDGTSAIDLTGTSEIGVPENVTLASDRGCNGSDGANLFKDDAEPDEAIFGTQGENITIAGFSLEGLGNNEEPHSRDETRAAGINVHHTGTEIYNNLIDNFVGRCIVGAGDDLHVHHNEISYCNQYGYGYGVAVHESTALIEANHFKHYRHAIAGSGESTEYEARYNIFGPGRTNSDVDMHGTEDTECSSSTGGSSGTNQYIHQNTFVAGETYGESGHAYIQIRGEPIEQTIIEKNWFKGDLEHRSVEERAIQQSKPEEGECSIWIDAEPEDYYSLEFNDNHYEDSEPDNCTIGAPRNECTKLG